MTEQPDPTENRPSIENDLSDRYHVDWAFRPDVKPTMFDLDKSQNNQARFNAIDQTTVDTYTDALKRGDVFPPVVAYRPAPRARYVVIDGNHRLAAHAALGHPVDMYEVDRGTDARTIALMTFAMNTRHGKPTSEEERVHQAVYLIDNGASMETAAAAVNIGVRVLRKAVNRAKADERADEVGLRRNEWDSINAAVKSRLVNISTDEGFGAAARFAFAAKLSTPEAFELVAQLNTNKSAARQVAIVKAHQQAAQDRIQAGGAGVMAPAGKRVLTPKARVNLALGQVMSWPEDNQAIIKTYAVPERQDAAKRMREAGTRFLALAQLLDPEKKK